METLDKNTQLIAVEKILKEMKSAEQVLLTWNAHWWENYKNCVFPSEYFDLMSFEKLELKRNCSQIESETDVYQGIPLKHIELDGQYWCDVCTIKWNPIITNNSSRKLEFNNTGEITLLKDSKKLTKQRPNRIVYTANYNVLSNDFTLDLEINKLLPTHYHKIDVEKISISLTNNLLTKRFNDIEIIQDLNTGMKLVRIVKKRDKRNRQNNASVVFEATLNSDDSLEMGAVAINTYKGNGKVNGTYRFDVSRKKGIRANFYSRKGVKVDLTTNPMLLGTANTFLLPAPRSQNSCDIIISDFTNATQNAIAKNLTEKIISFSLILSLELINSNSFLKFLNT